MIIEPKSMGSHVELATMSSMRSDVARLRLCGQVMEGRPIGWIKIYILVLPIKYIYILVLCMSIALSY
jgi:hypothetical protein